MGKNDSVGGSSNDKTTKNKPSGNDQENNSSNTQPVDTLSGSNENESGDDKKGTVSDETTNSSDSEAQKTDQNTGTEIPKQLQVLAESIEKSFADNAKTSLPRLTEKEVREFAKKNRGIELIFTFENDEKTSGFITLKEFGHTVRVPAEGSLEFGIDYTAGR